MKISGVEVPDWAEGKLLPGFGDAIEDTRISFSMDAKDSPAFGSFSPVTIAMYQGDYKMIYYKGYGGENSPYGKGLFELYNLKEDPKELKDLINDETVIAKQMQEHLLDAYIKSDQPFR
jgi:hypothetical protein